MNNVYWNGNALPYMILINYIIATLEDTFFIRHLVAMWRNMI